ncbi:Metalloendoproteinase 1 [Sesamum angolense]|uniref:Metalloendoproteinase 1 n=1 Tax=Sesamum angolense TaxID=2727404 RepID=A0AAE2C3B3_9LAMI|nr:Metalloendoproteinase 1 [Sesamum angolense]
MAPKVSYTCSSMFFVLLSLSSLCISHAHLSQNSEDKRPSPLGFLTKLIDTTHKGHKAGGLSELKKYLANLGYIDHTNPRIQTHLNNDVFDDTLETAVRKYQEFYNLKITGRLDQETVKQLQEPRCGFPDFHPNANLTSFAHNWTGALYTYLGTAWPPGKRYLTFSYPKSFRSDAELPMALAFGRWMTVSPFKFGYRSDFGSADVKVSFERRDHGDGYPFDGPYGVVAHSFRPTDGRLHFDADERWTPYVAKESFDLQTVGLHELGHILGLGHTPDPKASMYAYFRPGESRDLNEDDIRGIQSLYPN